MSACNKRLLRFWQKRTKIANHDDTSKSVGRIKKLFPSGKMIFYKTGCCNPSFLLIIIITKKKVPVKLILNNREKISKSGFG